jgi:hypothetical protein
MSDLFVNSFLATLCHRVKIARRRLGFDQGLAASNSLGVRIVVDEV